MNAIPEDNQKRISIKNRIKELATFLASPFKANGDSIALSSKELASLLFARAPLSFLNRNNPKDLAAIAEEAYAMLSTAHSTTAHCIKRAKNGHGFFLLTSDRPFIISSVAEAARRNLIDIDVLLHPIVSIQNKNYSLNYIELSKNTPELLNQFESILQNTIPAVVAVTDSFGDMQSTLSTLASRCEEKQFLQKYSTSDNQDIKEFLEWLQHDAFIFVGTAYWPVSGNKVASSPSKPLGAFAFKQDDAAKLLQECYGDIVHFIDSNQPLWISKLSSQCPILRSMPLTHLFVADINAEGALIGVTSVLGIFSSKGLAAPGTTIPLINRKTQKLIQAESASIGSHDHKFIVDTIDRMPKEEAIRLDHASLQEIIEQTIDVYTRNDALTTIRHDASGRGAIALVIMPRDWFGETTRRSIQRAIEEFFDLPEESIEDYLDLSAHGLARIYFHIPVIKKQISDEAFSELQETIKEISKDWNAHLESALRSARIIEKGDVSEDYISLFPASYKTMYTVQDALTDIRICNELSSDRAIRVHLADEANETPARIDVYSLQKELTLSSVLPVFEHTGLEILSDSSCSLSFFNKGEIYIHRFIAKPKTPIHLTPTRFKECLGPGLEEIFLGQAEDDVLSSLMLTANLHNRCVLLLRTYTSHLWQLNVFPRKHQIREALASNPKVALKFWELFEYKFNPARSWSKDERLSRFAQSKKEYEDLVREERDILKDRTLRALLALVENTVRTNFFTNSDAIAIKVHSRAVEFIPEPKPWMETFIHAKDIEGCHLRSGAVSRGGIRWSERPDDFRTEVLGLVKTQRVKNVFIVPGGAKGGFIVRDLPTNPADIAPTVQACYKKYIRTLLSLPDNRVKQECVTPPNIIAYDQLDPYFVVAADKGTATFSDTANGLASDEFHFWLDDAFASGGSNGYDHKRYGITARGAWECVIRHFKDIGLNYETTPFTAVGIGDLAGDVFGNGLIISDKTKLLAAFNHKHIFIDPNPNPEASFKERLRIFNLGRSQWTDYNTALISTGGGIYDRNSKEITLSQQAREALAIDANAPQCMTGEEVMTHILKAPVDLLWNGGIGTYVKASFETHMQVNDSANDRVRISAPELRCKVVGEGGNLGFTQRARIEFASLGGRINTDAIDNSGGVGLSDNEVNIKILFSGIVQSGRITKEERNSVLKEVALEVCEKVLQHNRDHAYRLTVSSERSTIQHEYFKAFLTHLGKLGYINRELDCLPQEDELYERLSQKKGLYRPELAVCLAASKMWIKALMTESSLIKEPELEKLLMDYFPKALQDRFAADISKHPLRESIIATQGTNNLVNFFGISYFYRAMLATNVSSDSALLTCLATMLLFDVPQTVKALQKLDTPEYAHAYIRFRSIFESGLRTFASWVMPQSISHSSIASLLKTFTPRVQKILASQAYDVTLYEELTGLGIEQKYALTIASFPGIAPALEVASLSEEGNIPFESAWTLSQLAAEKLGMFSLRTLVKSLKPQNRWEASLRKSAVTDIEQAISRIVLKAVQQGAKTPQDMERFMSASPSYQPIVQAVNELTNITFGLPQLVLIARQVRDFTL